MVPETLGAILVFLAFIVPGLAFELLRERRRPFIEETAFREASRISLTSMLFSLAALAILVTLQHFGVPWLVDASRWLTEGEAYVARQMGRVTATVLAFVSISLGLSLLTDWLLRRSAPGRIVPGSVWFSLFREHRPDGSTPWVHLRLKDDGTEIWGFIGDYTPDQKLENRELILEQPRLQYRRPGGDTTLLPSWAFITVRGEEIAWMKVQYIEDGPDGLAVPASFKRSRRSPAGEHAGPPG